MRLSRLTHYYITELIEFLNDIMASRCVTGITQDASQKRRMEEWVFWVTWACSCPGSSTEHQPKCWRRRRKSDCEWLLDGGADFLPSFSTEQRLRGLWSLEHSGKVPSIAREWHSGCKAGKLTFPVISCPPTTSVSSVKLIGFNLFFFFLNYKFIKILKNCHHKKKPSLQWTVSTCYLLHWLLFLY